jgi:hypothetical protein
MPDWIRQVLEFASHPSVGRAIVVAQLASMLLTQFVKFQLPEWLSDAAHARRVRLFAALVSMIVSMTLWPVDDTRVVKVVFAAVAAVASPTTYWLAVKVLYHFWPWLDTTLSARPSTGDKS